MPAVPNGAPLEVVLSAGVYPAAGSHSKWHRSGGELSTEACNPCTQAARMPAQAHTFVRLPRFLFFIRPGKLPPLATKGIRARCNMLQLLTSGTGDQDQGGGEASMMNGAALFASEALEKELPQSDVSWVLVTHVKLFV